MNCALLIGINYIGTQSRLYGCINDCSLVQSMLINNFGFKAPDIVFMRDDIYKANHNLYPSKNNIITQLQTLINKANSTLTKQVYIHYSGHGANIRDINGDESDGMDEFIVPIDYFNGNKRILDDELNQMFRSFNSSSQIFCVFDCCMSGTMLDLPFNYSLEGNNFVQIQENRDNALADKKNLICISGCRDNEYALDVNVNGQANGALTLGIFTVLGQSDWTIDLKTLIINLYKYLKDNRYDTQRPLLSSNKRIDISAINYNYKEIITIPNIEIVQSPTPTPTTTPILQQPDTNINNIALVEGMLNYFISSKLITREQLINIVGNVTKEPIVLNQSNVSRIMNLFNISHQ